MRKNPLTSRATLSEVEYEIKNWLKGAPDRHGGRAERAKKGRQRARLNNRSECRRSPSFSRCTVSPSPSRLNSNDRECNRMTAVRRSGNERSRRQIVAQCASTRRSRLHHFHRQADRTFRRQNSRPRVNGSSTQSRSTSVHRQSRRPSAAVSNRRSRSHSLNRHNNRKIRRLTSSPSANGSSTQSRSTSVHRHRAGRQDDGRSRRPTVSPSARGSCRLSRSPETRGKSSVQS